MAAVGSTRCRGDAQKQHHRLRRSTETSRSVQSRWRVHLQVGSWQVLQSVCGGRQSERQLCGERHCRSLGQRVSWRTHVRGEVWIKGNARRPVRQPALRRYGTSQRDCSLRLQQPLHQGLSFQTLKSHCLFVSVVVFIVSGSIQKRSMNQNGLQIVNLSKTAHGKVQNGLKSSLKLKTETKGKNFVARY